MQKYPIVKLQWRDHVSHDSMITFDNLDKINPVTQETTGYQVNETKEALYIAGDLCKPTSIRDVCTCDRIIIILKCCIIKNEKIGETAFLQEEEK